MIKRTLYFGNPAKLTTKDKQLVIKQNDKDDVTIPIEDIGFVILDHYGISISQPALSGLMENNAAIITTDSKHLPLGMNINFQGGTIQTETFNYQIKLKETTQKRLWQQTVITKIKNQKKLMEMQGLETETLTRFVNQVKSGDPENVEAKAARYYWQRLFNPFTFNRKRFGDPPNNILNYGYAILRAIIARSLAGSGLHPSIGIHHHNQYNAFCLADDIMEPYRPFVDELALNLLMNDYDISELTTDIKKEILTLPQYGVWMEKENSPLMIAASRTTASFVRCIKGEESKIIYPEFCS